MPGTDYITVEGFSEAEFTEKKSRFIGYLRHVTADDEAVGFINEIKSRHRKATHNVYAYILREGSITRYSDDGEPQGTAGVPVFEVLRKEGLTDVCCVVTRYFGGILLGGGGLVRAYSKAAKIAVEAGVKKVMRSCRPLTVTADYGLYGKIAAMLPGFPVKVIDTEYGADVKIRLICPTEDVLPFEKELTDICSGNVDVEKGEVSFEDFA
ncbi:MAG: YigZ family protein [Ruminococcus sp.]|nr:YigZ family protein [Ruminococcus sp.]